MKIDYSQNISWQDFFGIVYIFNEITHKTFILDELAREFWLLIKNENSFEKICSSISSSFDLIDNDQLLDDFRSLTFELINNDLLRQIKE